MGLIERAKQFFTLEKVDPARINLVEFNKLLPGMKEGTISDPFYELTINGRTISVTGDITSLLMWIRNREYVYSQDGPDNEVIMILVGQFEELNQRTQDSEYWFSSKHIKVFSNDLGILVQEVKPIQRTQTDLWHPTLDYSRTYYPFKD